ncbi:hypothetical protein KQI89_12050 [Clostridium sp. MSJ-4]|uniref:Oligosaccharide repeat unit polymerase n=1 Tax=Clostridium simiarum TaxID=2841506 RepID=A0ABS6F1U8_9CLOT|nr:hypothetical protein [Clostridium simiarum]MBU5592487.1 hypothetical protein [Clostridium simiarum]
MIFIALIEIFILAYILDRDVRKNGVVTFIDQGKLMLILWLVNVIMYNFALSNWYEPNLYINVVVTLIWGSFLIFSRYVYISEEDIHILMKRLDEDRSYKVYSLISNVICILGVLAFAYNVKKFGLAITAQNKIEKQAMTGATAYIVYMLVLCAQIKYILFRKHKRIRDAAIFTISLGVLFLTLNRGPLTFIFITILVYEFFAFIVYKERLSKEKIKATYISAAIILVIFIELFGFVGNLRVKYVMEHHYKHSINDHYKMSNSLPSGFMWTYIYLTSPLENASKAITEQKVEYTYFNNLLYPFIKFGANTFKKQGEYLYWLNSRTPYEPYLEKKAGLNVMSFITEAFQDLGFLGLLVYIGVYMLLAFYSIKVVRAKSRFSSMGKILIYSNIMSIMLWSVFVNSLKLAVVLLNIFFVIFIENLFKEKNLERIIKLKGKIMPWKK